MSSARPRKAGGWRACESAGRSPNPRLSRFSTGCATLDRLAQAAGVAALGDKAYHLECVRKVVEERAATEKFFDEIGWKYVKSSSNFILFEPSRADMPPSAAAAASLFEFLRSKKILLRYFAKSENVNKSIRLTVGTPEQMKAFRTAALQWKEGIK